MIGENWLKLKNRTQDFTVLMGLGELVVVVLHIFLELAEVQQGWTTAALRINNSILLASISIWFIANSKATNLGLIYGTSFDPIARWMVVGAGILSLLPVFFTAFLPETVIWSVPLFHAALGLIWLGIRTAFEFSGQS